MSGKCIYITTPIYYVNDVPHLGTAYCTIAADILARYGRLTGKDVFFLTGTDEHGEKIQQAAEKAGIDPQKFTDQVSQKFVNAWKHLGISNDDFIRTTEPRHKKVVLDFVSKALKNGDIYLGNYEGWYCVPDETFWPENQIKVAGKCPSCSRDLKKIKEENYFFKLSKYQDRLLKYIEANPDFILPESKRNEVVSFLQEDLHDISVSRTSFSWGIPFPEDGKPHALPHVIYVWFDALTNYISALSPLDNPKNFIHYWGTDTKSNAIHLVGKDILKFHAIYWPCFLMSLGLPLPKRIYAHGWWTVEGEKMSKSLGNAIDPIEMTTKYGNDAFRLFLFREFPFGQDGDFSFKNFKERVNADLANNLGNLVSRTSTLIEKNLGSEVLPPNKSVDDDFKPVFELIEETKKAYFAQNSAGDTTFERFEFHKTLNEIFEILIQLNKYINLKTPWYLAKDPNQTEALKTCLYNVIETLRISSLLLWPFIPDMTTQILKRIGQVTPDEIIASKKSVESQLVWATGRKAKLEVGSPLFPRIP